MVALDYPFTDHQFTMNYFLGILIKILSIFLTLEIVF